MPRGNVNEAVWEESEAVVKPYWDHYDQPWAVVRTIYNKKMAAHRRGEGVCPACIKGILARSKKKGRRR